MKNQITSLQDLKSQMLNNEEMAAEFKNDPIKALSNIEYKPTSDKMIYRIVVSVLGITILIIVIGVIALTFKGTTDSEIPTILTALGSASIGAIAGLLAPSPAAQS